MATRGYFSPMRIAGAQARRVLETEFPDLQTEQQHGDRRRARDKPPREPKEHDLPRRHPPMCEAAVDVGSGQQIVDLRLYRANGVFEIGFDIVGHAVHQGMRQPLLHCA